MNDDNIIVETLENETEWEDALQRLQGFEREGREWQYLGTPNPEPLAKLLLHKRPVPELVLATIAKMLRAQNHWVGGYLTVQLKNKRNSKNLMNEVKLCIKIRADHDRMVNQEGYKYSNSVDELTKTYRIGSTKVKEYLAMSKDDIIAWVGNAAGL